MRKGGVVKMYKMDKLLGRITVDPNVQHGGPCIKGTRTPAYVVLEALALGQTHEEIKAEYPPLTAEDIKACILYAALLAKEEEAPLSSK